MPAMGNSQRMALCTAAMQPVLCLHTHADILSPLSLLATGAQHWAHAGDEVLGYAHI